LDTVLERDFSVGSIIELKKIPTLVIFTLSRFMKKTGFVTYFSANSKVVSSKALSSLLLRRSHKEHVF
jgi:hypothetical protein